MLWALRKHSHIQALRLGLPSLCGGLGHSFPAPSDQGPGLFGVEDGGWPLLPGRQGGLPISNLGVAQ